MFSDNMPGFKPPTDHEKIEYLRKQLKLREEEIERLKKELWEYKRIDESKK